MREKLKDLWYKFNIVFTVLWLFITVLTVMMAIEGEVRPLFYIVTVDIVVVIIRLIAINFKKMFK